MMADRKTVLRLLQNGRARFDGIIKMVEEEPYCMDISQQVHRRRRMLRRPTVRSSPPI